MRRVWVGNTETRGGKSRERADGVGGHQRYGDRRSDWDEGVSKRLWPLSPMLPLSPGPAWMAVVPTGPPVMRQLPQAWK